MDCTTRSPCLQRLDADKGKWVNYQIRLRGLTQTDIAVRAGCSQSQVSNVLAGRTSSSKVYDVLCSILGLTTVGELLIVSRRSAA
ncbi:helix-turn-helix transcriptional regulator [uncultured Treponema sp.]|uniref:helix-turn-helix domain-containing protein n=1 Tax=uncultured Treponema sp. TaxID=162155 RepID=UPI00262325BB|nr:helix-turn-helix transcriptional regulator [uncultured Treponema sp.]